MCRCLPYWASFCFPALFTRWLLLFVFQHCLPEGCCCLFCSAANKMVGIVCFPALFTRWLLLFVFQQCLPDGCCCLFSSSVYKMNLWVKEVKQRGNPKVREISTWQGLWFCLLFGWLFCNLFTQIDYWFPCGYCCLFALVVGAATLKSCSFFVISALCEAFVGIHLYDHLCIVFVLGPAFFKENPALTHRLVPWLLRDLNILLGNDDENIRFVLHFILTAISKFVYFFF